MPVTSMHDTAAMSPSLRMTLPLPMLEDFFFLLLFPVVYVVLHFKVYPLALVKLFVGCLLPVYVNCCLVMFTSL